MKKIALISDTHGDLEVKVIKHLEDVDEIWHAGDIGNMEVLSRLESMKKTRAVYGNIDDHKIRLSTQEFLRFKLEGKEVLMTHIAGKPEKYSKPLFDEIIKNGAPDILVCGHSHILLVKMDKRFNMLWLNPGACGNKGFHKVKTILKFDLNDGEITNMRVVELGSRGV